MTTTLWFDALHDRLLSRSELRELQLKARQLYQVNPHIFEDELEALRGLGVVPLLEVIGADLVARPAGVAA
jgi:hypothetical protein